MSLDKALAYGLELNKRQPKYWCWDGGSLDRTVGGRPGCKDGPPPPMDQIRNVFCADLVSLMLRAVGKPVPKNHQWPGGTRSFQINYGPKMKPFSVNAVRRGDVVFRDYQTGGPNDEGHIGVMLGDGPNAKILQSWATDCASLEPGLNADSTITQSNGGANGGYYRAIIPREVIWEGKDAPGGEANADAIDRYFAANYSHFGSYAPVGKILAEEADAAGLPLALACALVEQESGGRNIFGCDHGDVGDRPPYCRQPCTEARVDALRASPHMNGVGLTQLTWWTFVEEAESMGGAHLPKFQCRVGFRLLKGYLDRYPYLEALGAYNAGEANRRSVLGTYAAQVAEKREAWDRRLGDAGPPKAPPRLKPNLCAVAPNDRQAALAAALVFERRGFPVGVVAAGRGEVRAFDRRFHAESVGTRQLIVVGSPTLDALLPASRQHVHPEWRRETSDYVGAIGSGFEATLDLLAAHMERYAGEGAASELKAIMEAK